MRDEKGDIIYDELNQSSNKMKIFQIPRCDSLTNELFKDLGKIGKKTICGY